MPPTSWHRRRSRSRYRLQYFQTVPFLALCRMQQPTAFRSNIKDMVAASFPVFWGVRRSQAP